MGALHWGPGGESARLIGCCQWLNVMCDDVSLLYKYYCDDDDSDLPWSWDARTWKHWKGDLDKCSKDERHHPLAREAATKTLAIMNSVPSLRLED